jgi:hypothetical protein
MKTLLSVNANIFYEKDKVGELKKIFELVWIVDNPEYQFTNEGEIIRNRGIKEFRFLVNDKAMNKLIESLQNIQIELKD